MDVDLYWNYMGVTVTAGPTGGTVTDDSSTLTFTGFVNQWRGTGGDDTFQVALERRKLHLALTVTTRLMVAMAGIGSAMIVISTGVAPPMGSQLPLETVPLPERRPMASAIQTLSTT